MDHGVDIYWKHMTLHTFELNDYSEWLFSWTFTLHGVMRQQTWGDVADYIIASSGVHGRMQRYDERIIKIDPYLPKLSQKDCVGVFSSPTLNIHSIRTYEQHKNSTNNYYRDTTYKKWPVM